MYWPHVRSFASALPGICLRPMSYEICAFYGSLQFCQEPVIVANLVYLCKLKPRTAMLADDDDDDDDGGNDDDDGDDR